MPIKAAIKTAAYLLSFGGKPPYGTLLDSYDELISGNGAEKTRFAAPGLKSPLTGEPKTGGYTGEACRN